jgi:hypothetical protein
MSDLISDDLTFIAAAVLLAQTLGSSNREVTSVDVEHAVTNAEKLWEEVNKRRDARQAQGAPGVVEASKRL